MNFAEFALRNRVTTLVLTFVLIAAGIQAFDGMARLEDPEFTIKDALVVTPYPGASAAEVEEEVSDKVELAIQQLGQLKEIESKSDRGLSTITASIKDKYKKDTLQQVWDELRRKVGDAQSDLPPGAGPSTVVDDFGDVWGVLVAIYGDEYTPRELREFAKMLRRELLLVKDVAKIDFWGDQREAVYVEPSRERMAQLGISMATIVEELKDRNVVADAGKVHVGPEYIAFEPTGTFESVPEIADLLLRSSEGSQQIYLRDIAEVRRGYVDPPVNLLFYDGQPAVALAISTVAGGNVVKMGDAVEARGRELMGLTPLGVEFGIVSLQSDAVVQAIDGFVVSLAQAVAIVVVVLLLFMGLRSGLLIGAILVITIVGSFIFLNPMQVALERISLGALIIALGMLVDNAIVVVDGMLVRMQQGMRGEDAASEVVAQTSLPLFGATGIAILAFAAIGTSDDSTGEFCRSLFQVVMVSLSLSWVTAVTITPVLAVMVLPQGSAGGDQPDPYGSGFYNAYRGFLRACIRMRWVTVGVVVAIFFASLQAFTRLDQSFFPDSTRPQFMVDFWLPQGTHIDYTVSAAAKVEEYLHTLDGVTHVTSLVGGGAPRFLLTYAPEKNNSAYAQFLVDVDDFSAVAPLLPQVEAEIVEIQPEALVYARRFIMGPGDGGKIQARFMGPDRGVLRQLSAQTEAILYDDGGAKSIRNDWRQRVKVVRPQLADEEANLAGISRQDVALAIKASFDGEGVGVYREADELLPIYVRAPDAERRDVDQVHNIQIWSKVAQAQIPLRQVVSGFETGFEDDIIMRLNRKPTITVHADPVSGPANRVLERIRPAVEALEMPEGFSLEWWGEYKSSADAQAAMSGSIPMFAGIMVLIVIGLFNSLKQPIVIFLTVPLALIGVAWGLLLTGQPFGFMALLGFLSLSGMLIKNAIVLIDEMESQKTSGRGIMDAIVESGVSRLRPVAMAAATTALGMIPLLVDAFFVAMAVTIISGLVVATILTMVIVPVLYAIVFRASPESPSDGG